MPRRTNEAVKRLSGTARADRAKPSISVARVSAQPDAGLDEIGRQEWQRVRRELASHGLLTSLDAAVLAAYCMNFSRWKRAEAQLTEKGEVLFIPVKDSHANVIAEKPVKNPMLAISESAQRLMSRFADQLGLSPNGRIKLGIEATATGTDDDDEGSGAGLLELLQRKQ